MFRNFFSNDLGEYRYGAEKLNVKEWFYIILGVIGSFIIPVLFVYLEAWDITINLEELIWSAELPIRCYYFISCIAGCISSLFVLILTPKRINGKTNRLQAKKILRLFSCVTTLLFLLFYVMSLIML